MRQRAARSAPIFALSFFGILGCTDASFAQSQAPASASGSVTLTATIRSVDAPARSLEVVTGVGPVLRVVKLSYAERALMKTPRGTAPPAELKPGDLVRIEYTKGVDGNSIKAIEALPWPGAGGTR